MGERISEGSKAVSEGRAEHMGKVIDSGHCPRCGCGDTVNLYGCHQCVCCGHYFLSEDQKSDGSRSEA